MCALAVVAGIAYTIVDYRSWKRIETENYGHGYNDVAEPALKLTKLYQNDIMRVRAKYPEGWTVTEVLKVGRVAPGKEY